MTNPTSTIPVFVAQAQERARRGELSKESYTGTISPEKIGDALYDPEEEIWVVRQLNRSESFSCGFECCGTEYFSVVPATK